MPNSNKVQLWAVFGEEEQPVALLFAKTEFGAKKKYEAHSGRSRHGIHVEVVDFDHGYFSFTEVL